jgi:GTP-sensing pleiotropic transcriptional regulator CodY
VSGHQSLSDAIAAEARLHILRELARQVDGRLNVLLLTRVLDAYGIRRDRDWVATQLRKLEALGAVEVASVGEMLVAKILRAGRDHVEERAVIEGIARPSEVE